MMLEKPLVWWMPVAAIAFSWNAIGIVTFFADIHEAMPVWVTAAYGIAVFSGTFGSLALLLRRKWATPLLAVSLATILVQMGHALLLTDLVQTRGPAAAILPLVIIAVAAVLLWLARLGQRRGWLA